MRKILLGFTTTKNSDWRKKVKEIDKYGIKEIALFPTCLNFKERKELYAMFEKTKLERIPHVHLRHDMKSEEIDYLAEKYSVEVFNVHPCSGGVRLIKKNPKYKNKIFIENLSWRKVSFFFSESFFKKHKIAGACLDFAHLEAERLLRPQEYQRTKELIDKCFIGCNHISAIKKKPSYGPFIVDNKRYRVLSYDSHMLRNLSELYYLKRISKRYFSNIISIELENSFRKQLEIKKYIEKIILNAKI